MPAPAGRVARGRVRRGRHRRPWPKPRTPAGSSSDSLHARTGAVVRTTSPWWWCASVSRLPRATGHPPRARRAHDADWRASTAAPMHTGRVPPTGARSRRPRLCVTSTSSRMFFSPADVTQVKYEILRQHYVEGQASASWRRFRREPGDVLQGVAQVRGHGMLGLSPATSGQARPARGVEVHGGGGVVRGAGGERSTRQPWPSSRAG